MKFLVVGASGFVGGNILAHVRSRGFEALGTQSGSKDPDLVTFDLLRHRIGERVDRAFFTEGGPVCVVICAVISNMDLCFQEQEMARKVNVEKTIQLIEDSLTLQARVVFISSCFVFDGRDGYYSEDDPCSPVNEYGRHKALVEEYLRVRAPEAFVARLDKIVGHAPHEKHLFATWHTLLSENQPIVCLEGSLLSPTYVLDVARALVLACEKELKGVYHVSNPEFFYRDELARQFCRELGKTPNIVNRSLREFNFPDHRALKSYLDGSRFAKETGMRFTSMRDVFREFARHLKP